ncbi:hypothetical protein K458DRAFT_209284 [Lentithecium fluviatile CBS 122367]|uniref:Polyprenal reductase n=1 Tax=Lentithecium fluviatile CBS 122367 TaxID=1168545 RepID=A0A6G1J7W1_9PLEO|nr:hypothetical protein K458DRAFT_209284 [Lentithecium fluviatile CBS 122367]
MRPPAEQRLLHPAVVLRAFYLAASALILVIQAVPTLRRRFLIYGPRATPATARATPQHQSSNLDRLLDYAASFQVPHNFFTHFYVVSVASALFWGWRLDLWKARGQVRLVWGLMLLQGVRRLVESYAYTSTSKSRMWFAHWILGLLFYLATNVAVWVELDPTAPLSVPWKTAVVVPAIFAAHWLQHRCHAYLYRLRIQNTGYKLPSHPVFPNLLCPHYTCEIAIYAGMSLLAAPAGQRVNWTLVCATIFVVVNLGVTAAGTKEWYMEKFGAEKVGGRTRMIPWVW